LKPHIQSVLPEGLTEENTVWNINTTGVF
ncbi:MAG: hypothetical protein JWR59_1719, partial [Brevundimonas sp.]|nr:hypothetical protein [Brevundimonas sp.]